MVSIDLSAAIFSAGPAIAAWAFIRVQPDKTPMVTVLCKLLKTLYDFRANRLKRNAFVVFNCFLFMLLLLKFTPCKSYAYSPSIRLAM